MNHEAEQGGGSPLRPRRSLRSLVLLGARWGVGLGLAGALLLFLDVREIGRQLGDTDWKIAGPVIAGLAAIHVLNAAAWKLLSTGISSVRFEWSYALRTYYGAQAVGFFTPSNVGADMYRAMNVRSGAAGWRAAIVPIAVQRVLSLIALLGLAAIAAALLPVSPHLRVFLSTGIAVLTGALVALVWGWTRNGARGSRVLGWLRLPDGVDSSRTDVHLLLQCAAGLGLSAVFHVASIGLAFGLVAASVQRGDPAQVLAAITLARLAILIPGSISGLGLQEAGSAILFPLAGLPAATGLAVSLLTRLGLALTALLGAISLAIGSGRTRFKDASTTRTSDVPANRRGRKSFPYHTGPEMRRWYRIASLGPHSHRRRESP